MKNSSSAVELIEDQKVGGTVLLRSESEGSLESTSSAQSYGLHEDSSDAPISRTSSSGVF